MSWSTRRRSQIYLKSGIVPATSITRQKQRVISIIKEINKSDEKVDKFSAKANRSIKQFKNAVECVIYIIKNGSPNRYCNGSLRYRFLSAQLANLKEIMKKKVQIKAHYSTRTRICMWTGKTTIANRTPLSEVLKDFSLSFLHLLNV